MDDAINDVLVDAYNNGKYKFKGQVKIDGRWYISEEAGRAGVDARGLASVEAFVDEDRRAVGRSKNDLREGGWENMNI